MHRPRPRRRDGRQIAVVVARAEAGPGTRHQSDLDLRPRPIHRVGEQLRGWAHNSLDGTQGNHAATASRGLVRQRRMTRSVGTPVRVDFGAKQGPSVKRVSSTASAPRASSCTASRVWHAMAGVSPPDRSAASSKSARIWWCNAVSGRASCCARGKPRCCCGQYAKQAKRIRSLPV